MERNNDMIFYGAGKNMKAILQLYGTCGIPFKYKIWDANARNIRTLGEHKIYTPDFKTRVSGTVAVITLSDQLIAESVEALLREIGYTTTKVAHLLATPHPIPVLPVEFDSFEKSLICSIIQDELTMVPKEGLFATLSACKYAVLNNIDGDFVECGVWRGGNAVIAAAVFGRYGSKKKVWLYDTFAGFEGQEHSEHDTDNDGKPIVSANFRQDNAYKMIFNSPLAKNSLDDVKTAFDKYGLLGDNIVFVKGDVMETLDSENKPKSISVLRLDTDWYESTRKELEVFYPILSKSGVLIIDDYGYCVGCKTAVDDYFQHTPRPLMHYVDYTRRTAIKI